MVCVTVPHFNFFARAKLTSTGWAVLTLIAALAAVAFLDASLFNHAWASGAGDAFSKGEAKGNELADLLRGKIAVTITGLVIGVVAIMMQMGRVSHLVGVRIIVGALIVGSCMSIAEFLYA